MRLERVRVLGQTQVLQPRAHLVGVGGARLDVLVLLLLALAGPHALADVRREEGERQRAVERRRLLLVLRRRLLVDRDRVRRRALLEREHAVAVGVERPQVVEDVPLGAAAVHEQEGADGGGGVAAARRRPLERHPRQRPLLLLEVEQEDVAEGAPLARVAAEDEERVADHGGRVREARRRRRAPACLASYCIYWLALAWILVRRDRVGTRPLGGEEFEMSASVGLPGLRTM